MSRIAIVGPGRVGTLLAIASSRAGHRVVAVAGGTAQARDRVVSAVAGVRPYGRASDAVAAAELVLLCVPDDALDDVVTELAVSGAIGDTHRVVHVAGSRGLGALRRAALAGAATAACHPAMTVPQGAMDPDLLVGAAWAVTARANDLSWARELVTDLGGDPFEVPDDRRPLYHAGLAVASNAVGAAVATARQLLLAAKVEDPSAFLAPLIQASVANVLERGAEAVTGPVVRGDVGTLAAHLAALERDLPELVPTYRALARGTLGAVRASLPGDVVARLEDLLADPRDPGAPGALAGPGTTGGSGEPGSGPPLGAAGTAPPRPEGPSRELPMHPDTP